jgi:hypothetical protein
MVESKLSRNVYPQSFRFFYYFFLVFHFKNTFNLFKNDKLISVSIITREYPNQRVDENSLYKIMVKVVLHINAPAPLPLAALAPAQVWSRSYVQGSGALTTRGPSWSGDGVAIAACDEPAASGVAPPAAGVAPPAMVAPPAAGVNCDG